jgi:TRAP-type C4-dicarboxylate transport system permease small subunit
VSEGLTPAARAVGGAPRHPWLGALNRATMTCCEALLVAMMSLIIAEVVARSFFATSLQFVDEYASYSLVWLTFLGISVALHDGALFSVGIFYDRLPPLLRTGLQIVWNLFALAFSGALVWQCVRQVLSSYEREMVAPTVVATPLWLPQLVMPIGGALVVVVLAAITAADLARLMRGGK